MTIHSWIRKLFFAPKPRTIRKARGRNRRLCVELLEDRITPADLTYTATGNTPLTLRLVGPTLEIINTTNSSLLASKALAGVTTGVRIDGAGHDVNLTIDASVPQVPGGVQFVGGSGTN